MKKKYKEGCTRVVSGLFVSAGLNAATPVWTYSAPNPAEVTVAEGETLIVQYTLTNQSKRAKNLILKTTPGLSASRCYLASKGSTCTLTLTIQGSQISERGLHAGPVLCEQANSNQCYEPNAAHILHVKKSTPTDTSLQMSANELALSITGLTEDGIPSGSSTASGRARIITITNTGMLAAQNVTYTISSLPSGTSISPASCGTIAALGSCVLTITPGAIPSAAAGDTNPAPILLSVTGDNTDTVQTAIQILTYGSVYQGGYVFALDDSKGCSSMVCTGSVGGTVVSLEDQKVAFVDGMAWDADPVCAVSPFLCTN